MLQPQLTHSCLAVLTPFRYSLLFLGETQITLPLWLQYSQWYLALSSLRAGSVITMSRRRCSWVSFWTAFLRDKFRLGYLLSFGRFSCSYLQSKFAEQRARLPNQIPAWQIVGLVQQPNSPQMCTQEYNKQATTEQTRSRSLLWGHKSVTVAHTNNYSEVCKKLP